MILEHAVVTISKACAAAIGAVIAFAAHTLPLMQWTAALIAIIAGASTIHDIHFRRRRK